MTSVASRTRSGKSFHHFRTRDVQPKMHGDDWLITQTTRGAKDSILTIL